MESEIPAADLVPGDLVVLAAGARVPADGRIVESARLQIEEAALGAGWLRGTTDFWHMLEIGLPLAIAAVPEGLPAVTTMTLALGMQRMARLER